MSAKILIIYTGGTIGMIKDAETGHLINVDFNHIDDHVPELKRLDVEIDTISFINPIDSSEINTSHWVQLAELIQKNYYNYDGFVILHGSDTMAYTSSVLSFMFDGLKKPVILTGSQLPIGIIRTDGKENLITAIQIASKKKEDGSPLVQEVAVYFDYQLFRGNRCTKDSAENFEAFRSPNYPELASAGVHIKFNTELFYQTTAKQFSVKQKLNRKVALLKFFPGINLSLYQSIFDKSKVDGVVIETFGSGNAPNSVLFANMLQEYINTGGVVLNITQCNSGKVKQGLYATSSIFNQVGVINGYDLTTEAAITKMMVVLNGNNKKEAESLLKKNLRGELSL